jgi:tetratricopeptide (TPR) repeat protein
MSAPFAYLSVVLGASAASAALASSASCEAAYSLVVDQKYEQALPGLDKCLVSSNLVAVDKARYLQGRAWALYSVGRVAEAIQDQEAAFTVAATSHRLEFINYAVMLRAAKRLDDSLRAIEGAERIDRARKETTMMTQYHKGWTLQDAGRHKDAIVAFSAAIPTQPDYPFVFLKRAASYEALQDAAAARQDVRSFVQLYTPEWRKHSSDNLKATYRRKALQYGLAPEW